jgi:hypothetical protein
MDGMWLYFTMKMGVRESSTLRLATPHPILIHQFNDLGQGLLAYFPGRRR